MSKTRKKYATSVSEVRGAEITDNAKDATALFFIDLKLERDPYQNIYKMSTIEEQNVELNIRALEDIVVPQNCILYLRLICGLCHNPKAECECENSDFFGRFQLLGPKGDKTVNTIELEDMKEGDEKKYIILVNMQNCRIFGEQQPMGVQIIFVRNLHKDERLSRVEL